MHSYEFPEQYLLCSPHAAQSHIGAFYSLCVVLSHRQANLPMPSIKLTLVEQEQLAARKQEQSMAKQFMELSILSQERQETQLQEMQLMVQHAHQASQQSHKDTQQMVVQGFAHLSALFQRQTCNVGGGAQVELAGSMTPFTPLPIGSMMPLTQQLWGMGGLPQALSSMASPPQLHGGDGGLFQLPPPLRSPTQQLGGGGGVPQLPTPLGPLTQQLWGMGGVPQLPTPLGPLTQQLGGGGGVPQTNRAAQAFLAALKEGQGLGLRRMAPVAPRGEAPSVSGRRGDGGDGGQDTVPDSTVSEKRGSVGIITNALGVGFEQVSTFCLSLGSAACTAFCIIQKLCTAFFARD